MRLFKKPVLCNYYVTYRCNASCSFCDIWDRPSPYVTLQNVGENLRDLRRLGVRVIDFTGGEPLLHREIAEMLTLARSMGFITTLTTNTLLYPKLAERLRGQVDMLHFSLDSVDEAQHNASRRVDCFGHLQRSIEIAQSLGERPDILFTVTNDNVAEIPALYQQYVREKGLHVILNPMFAYNDVGDNIGLETLRALEKWVGKPGIYLNAAFLDLRKAGGNHVSDPMCRAGSSTIVINPQNELVLPCYHLGLQTVAIEGQLFEKWNGPVVQAGIAQEGRLPGCEGCVVNCYMEPSMAVETGPYFWKSAQSTVKYALEKWVYAGGMRH
jgi:MoaA/NifB/PqqE/SkfB family radical SAM enzyme